MPSAGSIWDTSVGWSEETGGSAGPIRDAVFAVVIVGLECVFSGGSSPTTVDAASSLRDASQVVTCAVPAGSAVEAVRGDGLVVVP